jgi:hypothetical protein
MNNITKMSNEIVLNWLVMLQTDLNARFQVLTAASAKIRAFWDRLPCSLVEVDPHFRGGY